MKDEKVYQLAVIFSVVGLAMIYASSYFFEPPTVSAAEIDESMVGKIVEIEGEVTNFNQFDTNTFFDLEDDSGEINIVEFDETPDIGNGHQVVVTGRIDLYEGDLQVIAEDIE